MVPSEMILEDGSRMTLIHFAHRANPLFAGSPWVLACAPEAVILHGVMGRPIPHLRSDDPRAANCPMCQKTESFRAAMAQQKMPMRELSR